MKIDKIKNLLAIGLASGAMSIAATCSTMCVWWHLEEVRMPKSLYKKE